MTLARVTLLILLFPLVLCSQNHTEFTLPDVSIQPDDEDIDVLCRPGIANKSRSRGLEISYTYLRGGEMETAEGQITPPLSELQSLEALTFKVKIPVVIKDELKVLLGYSYMPETYRFSTIGSSYSDVFNRIDSYRLRSSTLALYATKPINEKYFAGIRMSTSFNGDYDKLVNTDSRYRAFNVTGLLGIKESDDLEWGLGLHYSKDFRRTRILPVLSYNRNFNEKWGLETVFPVVINGRYNINPSNILLFGTDFNSQSYAIDVDQGFETPTHFHLNHAELRLMLRLEKQLTSWVWLNLEGGYQYNFNTRLVDKTLDKSNFKVDFENNVYFNIGVFLSPPDKLMR